MSISPRSRARRISSCSSPLTGRTGGAGGVGGVGGVVGWAAWGARPGGGRVHRHVPGHRAEQEAPLAVAMDVAPAVARTLGPMGDGHVRVARKATDLQVRAADDAERQVAAHRLDAVLDGRRQLALELEVAADGDEAQLVEAGGNGGHVAADGVHLEVQRLVGADAHVARHAPHLELAGHLIEDDVAGERCGTAAAAPKPEDVRSALTPS